MCCTIAPARMSDTIVSCIESTHPETGRLIHVAGYQNKATSLGGPNAMLLPFPSRVPMGPSNVVDTTKAKNLLRDYAKTLVRRTRGGLSFSDDNRLKRSVQVFESGSYHIVLAANASEIPSVLRFVPSDKRPKVNQAIFDRYAEFYPESSWQLALCCWNGAVEAEPMLWWYEPNDTDSLFLPGLDAHDGNPPVLSTQVRIDHSLLVGSTRREVAGAEKVYFSNRIEDSLKPFVADHVAGSAVGGSAQNGDWRFSTANFAKLSYPRANQALFDRVPPPSA